MEDLRLTVCNLGVCVPDADQPILASDHRPDAHAVVSLSRERDREKVRRFGDLFPTPVSGGGIVNVNACVWSTLLGSQLDAGFTGDLLEIGVWQGHGSAFAAQYRRPGEKLIVLDKFAELPEFVPTLVKADEGAEEALTYYKGCSLAARKEGRASEFRNRVRWAHIDGEHSYEAVMSDLDLVADLMTEDGVIVIDDFFSFASPSITEAVFTWLRRNDDRFVLFLCGYFKAYLCSSRKLRHYLNACHELPERLGDFGHKAMLCMSGWSAERPYFGIDVSWSGHRYQRIGEQIHDAALSDLFFT